MPEDDAEMPSVGLSETVDDALDVTDKLTLPFVEDVSSVLLLVTECWVRVREAVTDSATVLEKVLLVVSDGHEGVANGVAVDDMLGVSELL